MIQAWKIYKQEWLLVFEFCMEINHCCFMTPPPGIAHSPTGLIKKNTPVFVNFHLKTHAVLLYAPGRVSPGWTEQLRPQSLSGCADKAKHPYPYRKSSPVV
jgi:hypothetical protein